MTRPTCQSCRHFQPDASVRGGPTLPAAIGRCDNPARMAEYQRLVGPQTWCDQYAPRSRQPEKTDGE